MSATWSLTYLETSISERELFNLVVEIFHRELDGKLYGLDSVDGAIVPVKLGEPIVEWFTDQKRATIITDSYLLERYSTGLLLYPPQNGLFALVDTVVNLSVHESGRLRREDLKIHLEETPDPHGEMLFHYMNFLRQFTGALKCHGVCVMYDRNPAGSCTSVHLYDSGKMVDDYYYQSIDAIGSQLIELPGNPEYVTHLLGGRFAFLKRQPRLVVDGDDEYVKYFNGEDLSPTLHGSKWDIFELKDSDLFVPFWDQKSLPVGAVYCLKEPLPDYFLKRYEG